eukprot:CAMPEP_0204045530 /NCGR_PEP_ID=MMETSP0360-20130528/108175_1 /ASSEMBLY_ACC=CAM_ASM_000342 /TAXON_ID=268821 /ORGANISM="Scrippsiella Hangoei, Strain SHTV-5" /LENGTH=34 /DNA_ID= /DNA_START= /DNA_END= /DNA_ORIENTATION=
MTAAAILVDVVMGPGRDPKGVLSHRAVLQGGLHL